MRPVPRILIADDNPANVDILRTRLSGHGYEIITANDGGAAWTQDEGNTWFTLPDVSGSWAVAFATPKAGWLVNGTDGRILKISF